jgi:hypothetical protein
MRKPLIVAAAALAAAALSLPAAADAKGNGHGKKHHAKSHAKRHHKSKAKGKGTVAFVFKGTVTAVDDSAGTVTVDVNGGNSFGRKLARKAGGELTFRLSDADLTDVSEDDTVTVTVRLPRTTTSGSTLTVTRFVDEDASDDSSDDGDFSDDPGDDLGDDSGDDTGDDTGDHTGDDSGDDA